jgi:hypothetical protein
MQQRSTTMLIPHLLVTALLTAPMQASPVTYPLLCRGGGLFVFDTLRRRDNEAVLDLAMRFSRAPNAAGADGAGLPQGTCSWIDRPLHAAEPGRVLFVHRLADPAGPAVALGRPDRYWHFMVYNTGQGHLEAVGHGGWSAPAATRSSPRLPLPFVYYAAFMLVAWIPATWLLGRLSAWHRLAEHYPAALVQGGRRIRCAFLVLGRGTYKGMAHLTADPRHLHVSAGVLFRPGYPTFSVPWSEISARRDEWRWSLIPTPVVRLILQRHPDVRFLIRPRVAEEVIAASGGRLRLDEHPTEPPVPLHRTSTSPTR